MGNDNYDDDGNNNTSNVVTHYYYYYYYYYIASYINSMVQCPTSQSNSNTAHPRIPRVLQNPNVHYRDQNSAPLVLILS